MNESSPAPWPHGLSDGLRDALTPRRGEPAGPLMSVRGRYRYPALGVLAVLGAGFTAGSIALLAGSAKVNADVAWPIGVLMAGPLAVAARWPLHAWRASAFGFVLCLLAVGGRGFWPWPVPAFLALLAILFGVGASVPRRTTVAVGAVTTVVLGAAVAHGTAAWFAAILVALTVVALAFGDAIGARRTLVADLAEQTELRRRDLARQAVLEERARIARELHDVVAHHMSVIAMQAEAAPYKIPDLPDAARDTFVVVRDAAREALTETRRVVGLLRADDEGAERAPQPGLDRLDDLLVSAEHHGLAVNVAIVGVPRPLEAGVDLSAFRIVQESLSNAGGLAPGARVAVELRYGRDRLTITVADGGARRDREEWRGGGHGLVGMRERVTMLGGALEAGPAPDGGWFVRAEIPYEAST
ncbi:sensor histidine kinase [Actinomadura kijaniata]|uniref:sensor histidine kinase n=1 Tax=Actinomadura kijaniata TaxID=46161 RepID=UPI002FEC5396